VSLTGASRVILVVEDEWLVRVVIVQALRDAGWQVVEASIAEDVVALMLTGHPYIDVVFTDIQLAGRLRGWDVAEQCRAARVDFPAIYALGNSADRSRRVAVTRWGAARVLKLTRALPVSALAALFVKRLSSGQPPSSAGLLRRRQ
jgi:CheY-like chemotaxis protein